MPLSPASSAASCRPWLASAGPESTRTKCPALASCLATWPKWATGHERGLSGQPRCSSTGLGPTAWAHSGRSPGKRSLSSSAPALDSASDSPRWKSPGAPGAWSGASHRTRLKIGSTAWGPSASGAGNSLQSRAAAPSRQRSRSMPTRRLAPVRRVAIALFQLP